MKKDITANTIYQYTVKPANNGNGVTLTVTNEVFTGIVQTGDLNVY
nr:hypothetical protein [uncultured Prevotella sp.]